MQFLYYALKHNGFFSQELSVSTFFPPSPLHRASFLDFFFILLVQFLMKEKEGGREKGNVGVT